MDKKNNLFTLNNILTLIRPFNFDVMFSAKHYNSVFLTNIIQAYLQNILFKMDIALFTDTNS